MYYETRVVRPGSWTVKVKDKVVATCTNRKDAEIEAAYLEDAGKFPVIESGNLGWTSIQS